MDPILSWVVTVLSAFLLAAGGYLFARARVTKRLNALASELRQLQSALTRLLDERKGWEVRESELKEQVFTAERALQSQAEKVARLERDQRAGAASDPGSVFERESVPHLQRVSEDEFQIDAAASFSTQETASAADAADELGGRDETKQFNLHSPENVVQFMQRIDELSEENAALKENLAEQEQTLKDKRAEGNEQIHRNAALEATTEKLRAELKRRNERIRILEDQVKGLLAHDDRPLTGPGDQPRTPSGSMPPPPPPDARPTPPPPASRGAGSDPPFGGLSSMTPAGPHDGPTLPVQRLRPEDLEEEDA